MKDDMVKIYTRSAGVIDIPRELHKLNMADLWLGISRIHRYGAQINWKVVEHSELVESLVPEEFKEMALHHDLAEGILGDLQSPLRAAIGPGIYEDLHTAVNAEIGRQKGWEPGWELHPEIVKADQRAFQIEVMLLLPPAHRAGFEGSDKWEEPTPEELEAFDSIMEGREDGR